MEVLDWISDILILILLLPYVLGPILVWWSQKMPERYKFNILDSTQFFAERESGFLALHARILQGDFQYIGSSELVTGAASIKFSIYNHFTDKLACTLITARSRALHTMFLEFTQMYADGSVLNVSNSPILSVYPKSNMKLLFRFPIMKDFSELLVAARKLRTVYPNNADKVTFIPGKEFEIVEFYLNRELQELVDNGWVSAAVNNGSRRLTLKGAIWMTWKMCWPVKPILNQLDIARAQKALQKAIMKA